MRKGTVFAAGLCGAMLVGGCSSGSDSPSPAVRLCNDLEDNWCDHVVSCLIQVGTLTESARAANVDECLSSSKSAIHCEKAVSTTSNYDSCMSAIATMDCARWNVPLDQLSSVTLPDVCKGVVLVKQ